MAKLISGKEVSTQIRQKIREQAQQLREDRGIQPGLAVILVGNDPASQIYVRNKQRACEEVGFHAFEYKLNENATEEQLLDLIGVLNKDNKVHGILVQMPLPDHLDEQLVIKTISPLKDVDAFHPINVGKIMIGDYDFLPCTPAGVMELIDSTGVEIDGKNCVVVGRSNIVGKPMAALLTQADGTVTLCHSKTPDLADITHLSFPHQEPQGGLCIGRHSGQCRGKGTLHHRGHGERGCDRDRRGHEPRRKRQALR